MFTGMRLRCVIMQVESRKTGRTGAKRSSAKPNPESGAR